MSLASSINSLLALPHRDLNRRFLNLNSGFISRRSLLPVMNSLQRRRRESAVNRKLWTTSRNAVLREDLEAPAVPTSVPVRLALELLQAGHRYLDVRSPEEFNAGHAPGATNIPYMYRVGSGMTKNPHFVAEVSSHFRKDDEIIIGCHGGKRSFMAAADLLASGFSCVTDIAGGFEAWSRNGLPCE